ncbi:MAG TPA: MDR family MFS transporter [Patescibacteria group bacterium]|nr:MDR family MFS transporter [Patescibacteria group bacterium]
MLSQITNSQKVLVMIGVMLGLLLAALDQTIVSTALPRIVQDLKGLEHLSWVVTAYLLTSTVTVPIYGKLSDIFGRKFLFLGAIVVFMLGSALSGISQDMTQLILFRGLQGIGGGALFATAFTIIADLFAPAERGKWMGIFGGVFGLSSVLGPTLGGYLTDHASWRWNFYINIPVGILALVVVYFLMPHIKSTVKEKYIDYAGAITIILGLVPFLLGLLWGGNQYPWASWQIIGLFVMSAVFLTAFIYAEKKAKDPILPLDLFKNNVFLFSILAVFLTGLGMFGAFIYIPLFAQMVLGTNATNSGLILTPMTFGIIIASTLTGQIVSRTGKYKILAVAGLALAAAAIYSLSTMDVNTTQRDMILRMIATGLGLGVTFPIFTITVQNAFDYSRLGVVTSATQLFRSLGGTVGVAVMGSILNNSLASKIQTLKGDQFLNQVSQINPQFNIEKLNVNQLQAFFSGTGKAQFESTIANLPPEIRAQIIQNFSDFMLKLRTVLAESISEVFLISSFFMVLAVIFSLFLKEVPLRKSHSDRPFAQEAGIELAEEEGQIPPKQEIEIFRKK